LNSTLQVRTWRIWIMKNFLLTTTFLLLCAGFALAQTTPSSSPSSSGTSSTQDQMSQPPSTPSTPPSASSTQDTSSQTGKQATTADNKGSKEKTVTGCLESAGSSGQYMVKHKNKDITVVPSSSVSSEIANHVGHKVKLYGSWEQASASASTGDNTMASTSGSNLPQSDQPGAAKSSSKGDMSKSAGAREFRVEKIEMVSDSCGGSSKSKDTTGTTTPKPY
jgi:hypothetical protein